MHAPARTQSISRPGFSLIETVISLTIVSVLFLGLSAAIMIGSYAIPSGADTGTNDREVIDALNMLRTDLRQAEDIEQRDGASGTQIRITTKSLKAAGQPNKVQYTYLTADNSFTRSTDNSSDQLLTSNIENLVLSFNNDGTNADSAYLLIKVSNTIQPIFELNAVLPDRPEYK